MRRRRNHGPSDSDGLTSRPPRSPHEMAEHELCGRTPDPSSVLWKPVRRERAGAREKWPQNHAETVSRGRLPPISRRDRAPRHGTARHGTPRPSRRPDPPVPNLRPIHFGPAASGSGSKKPAKVELRRVRSASSMRRAASRYWVVSPVDLRLRSASMSFASFS